MNNSVYDMQAFYDGLVAHQLIIPSGVPGVFGRGAGFERVVEGLTRCINRLAQHDGAEVVNHPPVLSRALLEKVNYLESFPHLCGSIHSFNGNALSALSLAERARNGLPWGDMVTQSELVMSPAACYSAYPMFTGTLPEGGRLITVFNWVYRHEPSPEPTRMMSFRMREFVKVGAADDLLPWRDMWLERATGMLQGLGLPVQQEVASDPFFGRAGKMMAASQVEQKLKFELVVPVNSLEAPTAVCSFNYHQDKFGDLFQIRQANGDVAHTACVAFGMERLTMALFKHHGFDSSAWPQAVRDSLWSEA